MPPEINLVTSTSPEPTTASLASREEATALRPKLEQIFDLQPGQVVEILVLPESPAAKPKTPKTGSAERLGPKRRRKKVRPA